MREVSLALLGYVPVDHSGEDHGGRLVRHGDGDVRGDGLILQRLRDVPTKDVHRPRGHIEAISSAEAAPGSSGNRRPRWRKRLNRTRPSGVREPLSRIIGIPPDYVELNVGK